MLGGLSLTGDIPEAITAITDLTYLDLSGNQVHTA